MKQVFIIMGKEWRDGMRNRWVLATTALLAALALTLAFLGSAPTGAVKTGALAVTIVSLSSLTIFLIPLIALLLSYDAIVGEIDRGTMALLLSYPVARWQVLCGKFFGHLAILAFATLIGYGFAGLAVQWAGADDPGAWSAFAFMIGTSAMLGGVFVAIGYFISTLVRDRGTAGGVALGVWLFFVLLYDMALLGGLVADQGRNVTPAMLNALLLLNPADVYRLLNLTTSNEVSGFAGVAGLGAEFRPRPLGAHGRPCHLDGRSAGRLRRLVRAEAGMKSPKFSARIAGCAMACLLQAGSRRGQGAPSARGFRRFGRAVLRHVAERTCRSQGPDFHSRPAGALLVRHRPRRLCLCHAA